MNYQCPPDLSPSRDLTVDDVHMFQRFQQSVDVDFVHRRVEEEFVRHLRLCELAILRNAQWDISWADLPMHPLHDYNVWGAEHLKKHGFIIDHRQVAREIDAPLSHDDKRRVRATYVESTTTAKWFLAEPLNPASFDAEYQRRCALEDEDLKVHPPPRLSTGTGEQFQPGNTAWAAILDGKYVVEVQRVYGRSLLCLYALDGKILHSEQTNVAFGATFGPDCGDVAAWQARALEIIAEVRREGIE